MGIVLNSIDSDYCGTENPMEFHKKKATRCEWMKRNTLELRALSLSHRMRVVSFTQIESERRMMSGKVEKNHISKMYCQISGTNENIGASTVTNTMFSLCCSCIHLAMETIVLLCLHTTDLPKMQPKINKNRKKFKGTRCKISVKQNAIKSNQHNATHNTNRKYDLVFFLSAPNSRLGFFFDLQTFFLLFSFGLIKTCANDDIFISTYSCRTHKFNHDKLTNPPAPEYPCTQNLHLWLIILHFLRFYLSNFRPFAVFNQTSKNTHRHFSVINTTNGWRFSLTKFANISLTVI